MIWIWIIAAWVLSYLALGKNKVRFEHLIWILLPVDMYGIQVAGVTIKPYMAFCLLLFVRLLLRRQTVVTLRSQWSLLSGILILLCIAVNLLNTRTTSSFMAAMMLLVVWGCCVFYLNECRNDSAQDICEVILAAGIGYGAVFVTAFFLNQFGADVPGLITSARMEPGILLKQSNVYQNQFISTVRLRGFTIDPNAMISTFLYSSVTAMLRITKRAGGFREMAAIILSALCIYFSNSRMGLICFFVIVLGSVCLGYKMASPRIRNIIKVGAIVLVFLLLLALAATDFIPGLVKAFLSVYANRSGLTDEYGRFAIWGEAVSVWWNQNILFGIGLGQMQYYTATGRACHNTWLEYVCGCGMLIGTLFVIHFGILIIKGFKRGLNRRNTQDSVFIWTMVLGTLGVMLSLLSVDNVTFSYLWFGAFVVAAIARGYWKGY